MKRVSLLLAALTCIIFLKAQNVGIGTATPNYPLTVVGSVSSGKSITAKNGSIELGFYNDSTYAYVQTWTPHNLNFATNNGSAKLTLQNSDGFVGINNSSPTAQMDINGTLRIRGNGAAAGKVLTSDASGNATWQTPAGINDVYSIGSLEFKSFNSTDPINNGGGQGGAYFTTSHNDRLAAPVHLPNGVKITQIIYGFYDNSSTQDFNLIFGSENTLTSSYGFTYSVSSSGAVADWRTVTFTPSSPIPINNNVSSYFVSAITTWPGNNSMSIKSAVISYTY